ncbi:class I SAM-dependent methyltransferase [Streptomyces sp. CA-256286]|nr:class I SAM-dependent methyltransferase [Streptomyces sp. CA-256286]
MFRKPQGYPRLTMFAVRELAVWWANRVGGVDGVPLPEPLDGRERCGRPKSVPAQTSEPAPALEQNPPRSMAG